MVENSYVRVWLVLALLSLLVFGLQLKVSTHSTINNSNKCD